jgi:hypothetical protein
MVSIKAGVRLDKLQPQMVVALVVAHEVYRELGVPCTVTSGNDGEHMAGSLHYTGMALDFRTRDLLPADKKVAVDRLRWRLGGDFDVVLEVDHVHIEFDQKA